MKYEIDIPEDVDHALMIRAAATGQDVAHLIQRAVVSFARGEAETPRTRRRPDLPLDAVEISTPCNLPRSSVKPILVERISKRRPDPTPEWA